MLDSTTINTNSHNKRNIFFYFILNEWMDETHPSLQHYYHIYYTHIPYMHTYMRMCGGVVLFTKVIGTWTIIIVCHCVNLFELCVPYYNVWCVVCALCSPYIMFHAQFMSMLHSYICTLHCNAMYIYNTKQSMFIVLYWKYNVCLFSLYRLHTHPNILLCEPHWSIIYDA